MEKKHLTRQMMGEQAESYPNVLNICARPTPEIYGEYNTNRYNHFSDLGAWHGYYLHQQEAQELYGGFAGPVIIAEEYPVNLSGAVSRLKIFDANGQEYCWQPEQAEGIYYPGRLVQRYESDVLALTLELVYATNRTAVICATIENKTQTQLQLHLCWEGSIYRQFPKGKETADMGTSLRPVSNGVQVGFQGLRHRGYYLTTPENSFRIAHDIAVVTTVSEDGGSYRSTAKQPVCLMAKQSLQTFETQSFTFTAKEMQEQREQTAAIFREGKTYFERAAKRWEDYLEKTFEGHRDIEEKYRRAAVKSMETLMTNWRSAAGAILHDGVVPSMSYQYFIGMWAWDSWKQAVGMSVFNEELAKNNVRALFDYQIMENDPLRPYDKGTIIDCIFYNQNKQRGGNGENWNERNSKPPLAAWAVWNIYLQSKDIDFVAQMYPKLTAYHEWWYTNRDADRNGIVEYGAMVDDANMKTAQDGTAEIDEDAVIEAAAWESGMDNAPRFDKGGKGAEDTGVHVLENKDAGGKVIGYSINQESVDLNAYLYAEKRFLQRMAELLGRQEDAERLERQARFVRDYVNTYMFDEQTGYYYDLQISGDGSRKKLLVNRGKGSEGWIPLWAKLATQDRAERVIQNMLDEEKCNTFVPLGTASKDNPSFAPAKYWRGPVWLDQAMYGVEAMQHYGYQKEARTLAYKIFDHAAGLLGDASIRENYHPLTGEGLHTTNFSWSASALYSLYRNILTGEQTTC